MKKTWIYAFLVMVIGIELVYADIRALIILTHTSTSINLPRYTSLSTYLMDEYFLYLWNENNNLGFPFFFLAKGQNLYDALVEYKNKIQNKKIIIFLKH